MRQQLVTAIIAATLLTSGVAMARPCDPQAIVGIWSLSSIDADEPGVEALYASIADKWMRFDSDGGFIYTASNRPQTDLAAITKSLDDADALDGVTYRVAIKNGSGGLLITRDGVPVQRFQCDIADRDDGPVVAGDMILSSVPGAPKVRRVQSRITP